MAELTPLMQQYHDVKAQHPGEVLFFRLGDFYEMFDDDAVEVSRLLNLTLTHRADKPMCGVPFHAAKVYIARLLRAGKKIAVCEQVSEPDGRTLAERRVVEVITPGTAVDSEYLDTGNNNFLASFFIDKKKRRAAFAYIDVTTSVFCATEFPLESAMEGLAKELSRAAPRELILPQSMQADMAVRDALSAQGGMSVSYYPDWHFSYDTNYRRLIAHFRTASLRSFSLGEDSAVIPPAGFLLDYLQKTTGTDAPHVSSIDVYSDNEFVVIDAPSRRSLELCDSLNGGADFTLFGCMDCTRTAMGRRLLRAWICSPLTECGAIHARQRHVREFFSRRTLLEELRAALGGILDVERLAGRIAMERAHAKDLQALRASLATWISCSAALSSCGLPLASTEEAGEVAELIGAAILDDPSTSLTEGRLIKAGWSRELDHYREVQSDFNRILEEYTESERAATGIQNLRVRFNRSDGYCLEVTKGKLSSVPPHFVLRRSLVSMERYTTARLHELEVELSEAGSRIIELERDLYVGLRSRLQKSVPYLLQVAHDIAYADVVSALAHTAVQRRWACPVVDTGGAFEVERGRHPVVEAHLPAGTFVPNDARLHSHDAQGKSFALITGPNMAGKSTFLRQNALIAILAQIGSFVPAKSAHIGVVDKIFCRVGASDNLAKGESTFLVEMTETAGILRSATERSLVIMDEVGRGTSTEDGLSIAWAVSEHLLSVIRCRTFFATHYHELTRMEHPRLGLLCMEVSENEGDVVFLRRVISGAAHSSYGIHVARLAGVPDSVIRRAGDILRSIQSRAEGGSASPEGIAACGGHAAEPALFSAEEMVMDDILGADENNLTPMQALALVARWRKALSGR